MIGRDLCDRNVTRQRKYIITDKPPIVVQRVLFQRHGRNDPEVEITQFRKRAVFGNAIHYVVHTSPFVK